MFPVTSALREAYLATGYVVCRGGRRLELRVGARPPALPWGAARGAAFVTAWNPGGRPMPVWWNRQAGRRLLARLRGGRCRVLAGAGVGDARDWPAEPSLLVFGLGAAAAAALGRALRQNAVVHVTPRRVGLLPLR